MSRSGDAILPLTAYLRIDGTVTPLAKNGDDYAPLLLVSTTYSSGGTSFTENLHTSPMTYMFDNKHYVSIINGSVVYVFGTE